jgi:hypothetical protein
MSDNLINQITLDFLMNKEQYSRALQNKTINSVNRQDKKFYKKRIIDLTKDLLSKPSFHEESVFQDVKYSFNNYIKTCIHYFKSVDSNDILQEEYKDFEEEINDPTNNEILQKEKTEADKLLMRKISVGNPLDKFIKKKMTKQQDPPIVPKQKNIDLADPELKNKGIVKRKKKENVA